MKYQNEFVSVYYYFIQFDQYKKIEKLIKESVQQVRRLYNK